jgi:hypothetical protein
MKYDYRLTFTVLILYQKENGLRKNCGSPHEVRAQKRHTYFVRVSAIFANHFCLGIVLLLNFSAMAWDDAGHKISARVAWEKMSPATHEKAIKLLQSAPEDSGIRNLFSGDSRSLTVRQAEFFAAVSTWADIIRDRSFAARYAKYHHGPWHYTNTFWRQVNGQPQIVSEFQPENENVVERLFALQKVLADETAKPEDRAVALAWILHLAGDIHQPLHSSARVTELEPKGDQGGNLFEITPKDTPREQRDNLHWYWDSIITRATPRVKDECDSSYIPNLASRFMKKYPLEKMNGQLKAGKFDEWAKESFELTTTAVYPPTLQRYQTPDKNYQRQTNKIAEERLTLAGYRMAELLSAALGS